MEQRISMQEVNQHLSRYIKAVEEGREVTITRGGRAVAKLVPAFEERLLSDEQEKALQRTRERMSQGFHLGGTAPKRDELYER